MPEVKTTSSDLKEYETRLQSRLQAKVKDFWNKVNLFSKNCSTMNTVSRKDTQKELESLQIQIQQFESNAQQSIADKNTSLLEPLQRKLKNTIDSVGKENGFT